MHTTFQMRSGISKAACGYGGTFRENVAGNTVADKQICIFFVLLYPHLIFWREVAMFIALESVAMEPETQLCSDELGPALSSTVKGASSR